jgi:hypothetical protein
LRDHFQAASDPNSASAVEARAVYEGSDGPERSGARALIRQLNRSIRALGG